MPLPSTIQAYQDCMAFMEKAIDDPKGARMVFLTKAEAEHWRMRCNQARSLHREQSMMVFAKGDLMYGCSEYDPLMFTIVDDTAGEWWCYARKMVLNEGRVELLSEVEDDGN